ncbi:hypothetical protein E2C01_078487 [Portunus trituberculatus]|uniref:Uncharacterized protein n=1 Tax=Portunus trituberculatus TaxID=210409 RepID=A0A5B7IEF5_PORTR|nr:hypothetical protein [Portunus trituberculatus]
MSTCASTSSMREEMGARKADSYKAQIRLKSLEGLEAASAPVPLDSATPPNDHQLGSTIRTTPENGVCLKSCVLDYVVLCNSRAAFYRSSRRKRAC